MNRFKMLLFGLALLFHVTASADDAPTLVQDSLKSLYPHVETVGWSTDGDYYVAGFQDNGFYMKVWFDAKGHWMMKQTDWQVMDEVPEAVYHNFTLGPYSTDEVLDVTYVEFPSRAPQIVVQIGIDNSLTQYQLFYSPDGEVIRARDTTDLTDILGASTFL